LRTYENAGFLPVYSAVWRPFVAEGFVRWHRNPGATAGFPHCPALDALAGETVAKPGEKG
jgi:hypothetical protein